jgi:predicted RNA-binding protein YlxR (DUF448 family)
VKNKKIPLRRCIGCYEMKPKNELVRIVKNKENEIFIDETGKKNGRGTYICKEFECFIAVKKAKKIEKTFEMKISDEIYDELQKQLEGLSDK